MKEFILQSELKRDWPKLKRWAEDHKRWNSAHSYWEALASPFLLTMTDVGESYPWHTDSITATADGWAYRNDRLWTRIIYISAGAPIQFGAWKPSPHVALTKDSVVCYVPDSVVYEIQPYEGLQIYFPSFFVHRVLQHTSEIHRWTIVGFLHHHPSPHHAQLYKSALESYLTPV